jgi:hypothetical protein
MHSFRGRGRGTGFPSGEEWKSQFGDEETDPEGKGEI